MPVSHTTKKELCNIVAGNLISWQRRTQCTHACRSDRSFAIVCVCAYNNVIQSSIHAVTRSFTMCMTLAHFLTIYGTHKLSYNNSLYPYPLPFPQFLSDSGDNIFSLPFPLPSLPPSLASLISRSTSTCTVNIILLL